MFRIAATWPVLSFILVMFVLQLKLFISSNCKTNLRSWQEILDRNLYAMASNASCGLTVVVLEEPTKPLVTVCRPLMSLVWMGGRKQDDVALALVWALSVKMGHIFLEHIPQGALTKQHEP
jgi:hypothetical protein